jgi:hypothetical protein
MAQVVALKGEKKSLGERHIYTQELCKLLNACDVGEVLTYDEMDAKIGLSTRPTGSGYGYQRTARIILERDFNIVFEVVERVGLKRLSNEQVATSTAAMYIHKKKSIIKHHKRRIKTVDDAFETLSPAAKIKTTLARTLLAFDSETVKGRRVNQIEQRVTEKQTLIGFGETVDLFKK